MRLIKTIFKFPMMKKRESVLFGHAWNKFNINDTFIIDLFSIDQDPEPSNIIFGRNPNEKEGKEKDIIDYINLKFDEMEGKVKAKSVFLSISMFSCEFQIIKMNRFKMKVKQFFL